MVGAAPALNSVRRPPCSLLPPNIPSEINRFLLYGTSTCVCNFLDPGIYNRWTGNALYEAYGILERFQSNYRVRNPNRAITTGTLEMFRRRDDSKISIPQMFE